MNKFLTVVTLSASLVVPFLCGMTVEPKQVGKQQVVDDKSPLLMVCKSVKQLAELNNKCAVSVFCSSDLYPPTLGDRLKNEVDQGAVCYKALTYVRQLDAKNISKEDAQAVVIMQNQMIAILKNLDEIGKYRLLWRFLVDAQKVADDKESKEAYATNPSGWYKDFAPKAAAVVDDTIMTAVQDCMCYEPCIVAKVLANESEMISFRAGYMDAVKGYVDWLEALVASKDQKTTSKSS